MDEKETYHQLRMVWPRDHLAAPLPLRNPDGYVLRSFQPGDEADFYRVMGLAGWPGWDDDRLAPWLPRIVPGGWFMAVHQDTRQMVGTCMALRDMAEFGRPGGELGWLACDPAHTGRGLGLALSAAVTSCLVHEGYRDIHLYTEDYRLAAIRTYLKLGYIPYLDRPEMPDRWRLICGQVHWTFEPDRWATLILASG